MVKKSVEKLNTPENNPEKETILKGEPKPEKREVAPESREKVEKEIDELRQDIKRKFDRTPNRNEKISPEERAQRIQKYQEKYLPLHLRDKKGIVSRVLTNLWTRGKFEKDGTENIPQDSPFIVIGNHFGGGDAEAAMQTFKENNLHFGVAKEVWWNSPMQWALKKLGMIPIEESLSNLTEEQKEEALKNQVGKGKEVFRKIIDREKAGGVSMNTEFVRQAVALLSRGESVGVYPEGLWLHPEGIGNAAREHKEMKQGYRGIELIAKEYQKLTGKELPIVPTAYTEEKGKDRKIKIGKPLKFSENDTKLNGTDWAMAHVAEMLPEEQRGYYKDKIEK